MSFHAPGCRSPGSILFGRPNPVRRQNRPGRELPSLCPSACVIRSGQEDFYRPVEMLVGSLCRVVELQNLKWNTITTRRHQYVSCLVVWGPLLEMVRNNPGDAAAPKSLGLIQGAALIGSDAHSASSEQLVENYIDSPLAQRALWNLVDQTSREGEERILAILANNNNPTKPVSAKFFYAESLLQIEAVRGQLDDEGLRNYLGPDAVEYVEAERDVTAQAIALLKEIIADEKDHERVVERARSRLFALEHLAVGKEAPEIQGKDLDDVEFNLSDYRGRMSCLILGPVVRTLPGYVPTRAVARTKSKKPSF